MRPETFLGLALELIESVSAPGNLPADARVGRFFRERRFLGSKDRRLLGDAVYSWLRHVPRARARWGARGARDAAHGTVTPGDVHVLDVLALARDGLFPRAFDEVAGALQAVRPGPAVLEAIGSPEWPGPDAWPADPLERTAAELSLPRWIAERLVAERGEEEARALGRSLLQPASVDLRVQLRKVSREDARRSLEEEIEDRVEMTPWSTVGLRLPRRRNLTGTRASREGWIEVEDEGSQIAVHSLDAAPGMKVLDACAGAGGKALALADIVLGDARGGITASDVSPRRLEELARRAREAGVLDRLRIVAIEPEGPLPREVGPADLVLVDAPCSGLGTLRRNPELKLRWGPDDIARFASLQLSILERFLPLARPGGRIAYVTCSILAEENERVADAFESSHRELARHEPRWAADHLPAGCVRDGRVRIDPATTGTDAFFVAAWKVPG